MQRQLYNKFDSNDKSVDGVLGTRTRDGGMMEGAELWRTSNFGILFPSFFLPSNVTRK